MIPIITYLVAAAAAAWGIFLVVGGRRHLRNPRTPLQTAAVSTHMASIFSLTSGAPTFHVSPNSTSPTPSAPWWNPCYVCSSSSSLRCSRCKVPRYCSEKCQIIHWKQSHREECRLLSAPLQRDDAGSCSNQKLPNNPGPPGEAVSLERDDGNDSETVRLTDPDVLVCPICFENLSIPIYQCKNGHILCSVCSSKIKNFCPACNSQSEHYRCRGIEKILESAKTACPNKKFGCLMIIPWMDRHAHESACLFPPYCCPITNCGFVGTYLQLSAHVASEHDKLVIKFSHGFSFRTIFARDLGFRVLLDEKKGTVFVLRNQRREDGNVFSISVIGFEQFFYEVTVKNGERFESINVPADTVQRFQVDHVPTHYLDVRDSYFNSLGEISLKIKIFAQGKRR